MKTCVMLENVVVYDGGKKVPWDVIWEVVRQLDRAEVVERLQKNKKKITKFEDITRGQSTNYKEEMAILGVKIHPTETLEDTKKRVLKRIKVLDSLKSKEEK